MNNKEQNNVVPTDCQKYRLSDPEAECDCASCVEGQQAVLELKSDPQPTVSWEEEFDEFIQKEEIITMPETEKSIKSFIASQIAQAEERVVEKVVKLIDENIETVNAFTGDGFVTKDMKSFALIALKDVKVAIKSPTPEGTEGE